MCKLATFSWNLSTITSTDAIARTLDTITRYHCHDNVGR